MKEMYPAYRGFARAVCAAEVSFRYAWETEKTHAEFRHAAQTAGRLAE